MSNEECNDCSVEKLQKFHKIVERRLLRKLPEEVQEPLLEAKRQLLLAVQSFIESNLQEEKPRHDHSAAPRTIRID